MLIEMTQELKTIRPKLTYPKSYRHREEVADVAICIYRLRGCTSCMTQRLRGRSVVTYTQAHPSDYGQHLFY
jgi:hypothetical protein